jgi:hypothetical protein
MKEYFRSTEDRNIIRNLLATEILSSEQYENLRYAFDDIFKNAIKTPIGTVLTLEGTFEHIIANHQEMRSVEMFKSIEKSLKYPKKVVLTKDRFGIMANAYIGLVGKKNLLVIDRNGLITAYVPRRGNITKIISKGEILYDAKN